MPQKVPKTEQLIGSLSVEDNRLLEPANELSVEDNRLLELAHEHLEHPSLAARLTSIVGTPIEIALKLLPKQWYERLHDVLETAIEKALDTAISSFRYDSPLAEHPHFHTVLSMGSGAFGGFFGLPGLLAEIPVTTTIMLRAIADIARSQGEHLADSETRLACMEVFALGGRSEEDDAADTGYYGLRLALAMPVSSAARHMAQHGVTAEGSPALLSAISAVSSRFGTALSQKAAAQAVPLVGAAGAAAINAIFLHHFQDMARHHFTIRRLERKYGAEVIEREYFKLTSSAEFKRKK